MKTVTRSLFLISCFIFLCYSAAFPQQGYRDNKIDFRKVDSLAVMGQPKNALALINTLYTQARAAHNSPMVIKSVLYRALFKSYLEEDAFITVIADLKQDIKLAKQPEKSVLQSLLAETYWNYYQQYNYQIAKRTYVEGRTGNDIKTWSVKEITNQVIKTYLASLSEVQLLQRTKIGLLNDVLTGDSATRSLRPTLYDLLAHRALDVFMDTRINVANIEGDMVNFSNPLLLADYRTFLTVKLPVKDSLDFYTEAIHVFQTVLQFHNKTLNRAALADADLKRLKFIYQRNTDDNRRLTYLNALQKLETEARQTPVYADILYEQAVLYSDGNILLASRKPDAAEAIKLARKAIAAYPESNGGTNAKNLIKIIEKRTLSIQVKEFNIPGRAMQLYFDYKNIDTARLKLYKIPSGITASPLDLYKREEYTAFLKSYDAVKEWLVVMPPVNDYAPHTLIDKIEALPLGNYMLIAQNKKDTSDKNIVYNYVNFKVTSLAVSARLTDQKTQEYTVLNSLSGAPLKNVHIREMKASVSERGKLEIAGDPISTDKNGNAVSDHLQIGNALVTQGIDSLHIRLNSYAYTLNYKSAEKRVVLFTDRPIYRPGQTVFYKGICLKYEDPKNSIVTGEALEVSFMDINRKEIQKIAVTSNDYGTFQGSFSIPAGRLNGRMEIRTKYGAVEVNVEEYKRPAFEISFDQPEKKYRLNDTIKVQGRALTFAGYPVTGAKVKYTVNKYVLPQIDKFGGYRDISTTLIATGQAETIAGGYFKISFFPGARKDAGDNYSYQVAVEITDLNGETRNNTKAINLGRNETMLDIDLPDQLFLRSGNDTLHLNINNYNREPVTAKIHAEWFKLEYPGRLVNAMPFYTRPEKYTLTKEEFLKTFSSEEYEGDGNPANWPAKTTGYKEEILVKDGKARLSVHEKAILPGYYKIKFLPVNSDYDTVAAEKIVRVYPSKATTIQSTKEWLVAENTTVIPGGTAVFRLAGSLPDGKAWYEVYYKGKILEKVWLKTSPEQSIIKISSRPEFEGEFAVQFTMVQNGNIFSTIKKIDIIDLSKELDVKFLTFRNKLQPGEKESWKLRVSNKNGEKQMAEMVATLYDASLDNLRKMEWDKLNRSAYNYSGYAWSLGQNSIKEGSELWFLVRPSAYYGVFSRKYEQLNLFGFNYYGGRSGGYPYYLQKLKMAYQNGLSDQAVKKLSELKQGNILYGIVTDDTGYAIPGAGIRSGKMEAITDQYGIYKIDVKAGDQLHITYIGFKAETITVSAAKRIDIILKADDQLLYEKVVIGYGQPQYKRDLTDSRLMDREVNSVRVRGGSTVTYDQTSGLPRYGSMVEDTKVYDFVSINTYDPKTGMLITNGKVINTLAGIVPRTNFFETAFFYPQLQTNDAGEINIDFTIPQSITRYKMMGFAHTKDLKAAYVSTELVTQKQLSISANAPRFFREGDTILLSARLSNISGARLSGEAVLETRDALTGKVVQLLSAAGKASQHFEVDYKGNEILKWPLIIPVGISAITYKLLAQSGKYSDGEEMTIPVLPNAMLVTESMPLNVRGNASKTFTMDKLLKSGSSKTLRNQGITLEFTANPAWYAVQALPYLMEYPYDCSEQTFNRFYANSFAAGIINSSPKIKEVFSQWQQAGSGTSLLSELEKNPELKSALLQETPWVTQAGNETERKKRLAALFDLNRMGAELQDNFQKLRKMQLESGAFSWFTGMPEDRYITQYIVAGIGQLNQLKLIHNNTLGTFTSSNEISDKAIAYLDGKLKQDYQKEHGERSVAYLPLHYLYARSYFDKKSSDADFNKAYAYYLKKVTANWLTMEPYQQGQAALVLYRNGNKAEALKIINLLKDRAQHSYEMGMYWTANRDGGWWYQSSIETQALLIAVFSEVAADAKSVEEMKIWLLKNKQTNNWKTTKATAAACYALLGNGYNMLEESAPPEILLGGKTLGQLGTAAKEKEAGTGYQKISMTGSQVKAAMGKVQVKNNNKTTAWGALYWQYFEKLDQITTASAGIKIKKQLFLKQQTEKGEVLVPVTAANAFRAGDLVKVRIEIYADRDMEYVHLKDMRAAGFEPVNVISQYKYQDGLGYYETTKDASSNFFISYLRKGVYVFEYALRVTHEGNFSNGITTLQCMYAPEFSTHSEGIRVKVK